MISMLVFLQNFYIEILNPKVKALGAGAYGRCLVHKQP